MSTTDCSRMGFVIPDLGSRNLLDYHSFPCTAPQLFNNVAPHSLPTSLYWFKVADCDCRNQNNPHKEVWPSNSSHRISTAHKARTWPVQFTGMIYFNFSKTSLYHVHSAEAGLKFQVEPLFLNSSFLVALNGHISDGLSRETR